MQNDIICSEEKIVNTLKEVLKNHGLEEELYLTPRVIRRIESVYTCKANYLKTYCVIGELDTFKVGACLMIAINQSLDIEDSREKAQIALDTVYSFIEKPYYNVGPDFDEPVALEEVNLSECFKDNRETFEESNNNLIASLTLEKGEPINYFNNLEILYKLALLLKHKDDKAPEVKTQSKKRSLKDIFKRNRA